MNKLENFKIKATKKHNGIYDYSDVVYIDVDTKVKIICHKHGPFFQTPRSHLYKQNGCNACAVDRSKLVNTKTTKRFIDEAREVHGTIYDYSLVEYKNAITPVTIICSVHGPFTQLPSLHTRGCGCKKCAVRLSQREFVDRAHEKHENKYNYDHVIYNTGKHKIDIVCPTHGTFNQSAESHLQGIGCPLCALEHNQFVSQAETDIATFIKDSGFDIITNTHSIIPPKELDIVIPELKLAIEYNGIYWHSELGGKDKNYHINKTKECQAHGIRLIHIFESEWVNKKRLVLSRIKNLLGVSTRIYARQCQINTIEPKIARQFLNDNHIQGFAPSSVYVGLYHKDVLVAVMTFGKPRYQKNIQWELIRYCNLMNCAVIGGASKLMAWFIKNYHPTKIISYSDKRWNTGKLYQTLNFEFSHTSAPNYWYFSKNSTTNLISRTKFQKHKLDGQLELFNPSMTEWENMKENGYNRIWDCGNDVWIWKNSS